MFKIETNTDYGWTDDPSILGHGCTDKDNRWPTEAAALAVCTQLVFYAGFDRSRLRVVPVHTMTNQLRRAYYSPSAAKLCGSNFYRGSDGSEIEVTNVEELLDSTGTYGWPDAVAVGPVTEWIRQGQAGRNSLSCLE